jgi:hypothetical protein
MREASGGIDLAQTPLGLIDGMFSHSIQRQILPLRRHQSIMTATTEECNARGRSQTQWERGPDLYPVPNVPTEVGADIAALSF